MKASIKMRGCRVDLEYDGCDSRVSRTFYSNGSYVFEAMKYGNDRQVCDGLSSMGNTLMASKADLLAVVRREYHAMQRRCKAAEKL